jgi:hypothetical protein
MITDFILKAFHALIYLLLSPLRLLPDVNLEADFSQTIGTAGEYISALDVIFPVGAFLTAFGVLLLLEGGIFTYKGINWLIRKIPGVN